MILTMSHRFRVGAPVSGPYLHFPCFGGFTAWAFVLYRVSNGYRITPDYRRPLGAHVLNYRIPPFCGHDGKIVHVPL